MVKQVKGKTLRLPARFPYGVPFYGLRSENLAKTGTFYQTMGTDHLRSGLRFFGMGLCANRCTPSPVGTSLCGFPGIQRHSLVGYEL